MKKQDLPAIRSTISSLDGNVLMRREKLYREIDAAGKAGVDLRSIPDLSFRNFIEVTSVTRGCENPLKLKFNSHGCLVIQRARQGITSRAVELLSVALVHTVDRLYPRPQR